ncbi:MULTISPECIES: dihydrolipoyl dehydrogenase [Sphingobium]|uniref:dihydrolipoyl dehydrogenase n=1 Tax=Sphingobium TaxID=165695 RepID=UPI001BE9CED7|nr:MULTISPECIES: dihydrolipoyl dehydrogenase [Sphingobium]MBT2246097.1 dihydrolipoyl dehydrogenase [Sphingobium sp. BHU LFT2]WBQ19041.1 dihydrolipoyl dehydrogenase [Sphingobium yanoikuyae]
MTARECDVAIIGAGTAGLAAERSARRHGAITLLIDQAFAGTTCTTVGCMPSKLLIAGGNAAHAVRHASTFGIDAEPLVRGTAVMSRLREMRDEFIAAVKQSMNEIPNANKVEARAAFDGPTTLRLDDGTIVRAKAVVIATGAKPSIPDPLRALGDRVLTNETLFDLPDLPHSVGVVGAAPLGLELAQALSRLGVDVMVFDEGDKLAGLDDDPVAQSLRTALEGEFPIHLGVKVEAELDGEAVRLRWSGASEGEGRFDYLLAAAGRPPNLTGLDLDRTGLTFDEHGIPDIDPESLQCGHAAIFMAGDADHERPVLHEAQAEGTIAGRNAARYPDVEPSMRMTPLSIMFTDPNMAIVGTPPGEEDPVLCGTASYDDQGRAKMFATNIGRVHIYAQAEKGRLLSAVMIGPAVEHGAHLLAHAIQQKLTASELLDMPFYHPTYEEGLQPALREICKRVSDPDPTDREDGFMPGS